MIRRWKSDDRDASFRVGTFVVRPDEGLVGDGTSWTRLEPQVMAVLVHLARRAGRVVSREELLAEVWNGTAVTDGAVTRCIAAIRRTMRTAESGDPIRTLPKRGYRLDAAVRFDGPGRRVAPVAAVAAVTAIAAVAVVAAFAAFALRQATPSAGPPALAVERFRDLDERSAREGWGEALTDELTARLDRVPGWTLTAGGDDRAEPRVVLAGSVRREGDSARLFCRLTDTQSRAVLCAETCSRPATPRVETQARLAREMAGGVRAILEQRR